MYRRVDEDVITVIPPVSLKKIAKQSVVAVIKYFDICRAWMFKLSCSQLGLATKTYSKHC